MTRSSLHPLAVVSTLVLVLSATGIAEEAVHEINQAAVEEGLAPCGTTAGFPCVLDQPGSYRLTSNLVSTNPDRHILEITVDDVHLDLGGFALIGPVQCSWTGSDVSCTDIGFGDAISAAVDRLTVRNGTVRGAGRFGVLTDHGAVLSDLHIFSCAESAIWALNHLTLKRCVIETSEGIASGDVARVTACTVRHCTDFTITVANYAMIADTTIEANNAIGIEAGSSASLIGNVIRGNLNHGLQVRDGSLVIGNTVTSNAGYGLLVASGTAGFGSNVFGGNWDGTISGSAVALGTNLCEGNTICP